MSFNVNRYWDTRHKTSTTLQSGGDKGLSEEENKAFYFIRIGRLLEIIRAIHGENHHLSILDAGCGKGLFTNALRQCGYHVVGIDSSPTAIEYALEEFGGEFLVEDLTSYRHYQLFDVVICIDVLFHLVDDEQWRHAFCNLASACKSSGSFIFTDSLEQERREQGDYIVHRSREDYEQLIAGNGLRLRDFSGYKFGCNLNGFAVVTSVVWGEK